jgi:hypothetical protein
METFFPYKKLGTRVSIFCWLLKPDQHKINSVCKNREFSVYMYIYKHIL